MDTIIIECEGCVMRSSSACDDCLVTYMCESANEQAVVLDLAEQRAVRWFAEAGMVPTLRHRAQASA